MPTLKYYDEVSGTWKRVAAGGTGMQGPPGADGVDGADGVIQSIVPGTNISVDSTDPANPIVSSTAGGSVTSVNTQTGVVILDQDDIADGITAKQYTATEKTKLAGVEAGAQVNTVASVAGKTGAVTLVKADVGLGNVDNTSDATKNSATATLTNKRVSPRTSSTASATSITPNISTYEHYFITALAANITINVPTGTPVNGEKLLFRIKDNGTSRTITWNAIFRAIGVTLPTTTTVSKTVYIGCVYNSADTKWDVIAVSQEA